MSDFFEEAQVVPMMEEDILIVGSSTGWQDAPDMEEAPAMEAAPEIGEAPSMEGAPAMDAGAIKSAPVIEPAPAMETAADEDDDVIFVKECPAAPDIQNLEISKFEKEDIKFPPKDENGNEDAGEGTSKDFLEGPVGGRPYSERERVLYGRVGDTRHRVQSHVHRKFNMTRAEFLRYQQRKYAARGKILSIQSQIQKERDRFDFFTATLCRNSSEDSESSDGPKAGPSGLAKKVVSDSDDSD